MTKMIYMNTTTGCGTYRMVLTQKPMHIFRAPGLMPVGVLYVPDGALFLSLVNPQTACGKVRSRR